MSPKPNPQQQYKKDNAVLKSCAVIFALLIVIVIGGGLFAYNWYQDTITAPASGSTDKATIIINQGDILYNDTKMLADAGVIKSDLALKIYLKVNNLSPNIKPGTYVIAKNLTIQQVIDILEKGQLKRSVTVTLREGLRDDQVASTLNDAFNQEEGKKYDSNTFLDMTENPDNYKFDTDNQAFLDKYKPKGAALIGFLYPDTYNFDFDSTPDIIINQMIKTFRTRLQENNVDPDNIAGQHDYFHTFYDGLTIASVIEKESGANDDKGLISSVFHNRLDGGMYLQSDATINFLTKNNNPRATLEDQQIDSPYNTYKYPGIPPTPISNPGIQSIIAALKPTPSNYYFFRHDQEANIYFNETYEQHLESIQEHP